MFWDSGISFGGLAMWLSWGLAFSLILASATVASPQVGHMGLGLSALAAVLTTLRDNQRTRRMMRALVDSARDGGEVRTLR